MNCLLLLHRHVGDFGNVYEDGQGNIMMVITDYYAKLSGPNNIIGRGLVVGTFIKYGSEGP